MAEEQAFDRVHRMGQTKAVVVTRYIMKDSVEEVISLEYTQIELQHSI